MSPNFYRNSRDITRRGNGRGETGRAASLRLPPPLLVLSVAGPRRIRAHSHADPHAPFINSTPRLPRARSRAPPTIHTARPAPFINTASAPGRAALRRQAPRTRPGRRGAQPPQSEPGPGLGPRKGPLRAWALRYGSATARNHRAGSLRRAPPRAAPLVYPPPRPMGRRRSDGRAVSLAAARRTPARAPLRRAPLRPSGWEGAAAANGRGMICVAPPGAFLIHKKIERGRGWRVGLGQRML